MNFSSSKKLARIGTALGAAALLTVAAAASSTAAQAASGYDSYPASTNGCSGYLVIQHNYNGTQHDYAAGVSFVDDTLDVSPGWTCRFVLERSTDGGHSWYAISGYHSGLPGDNGTGYYYDGPNTSGGPNYMARVTIDATNNLGNWTNIVHTAAV
ncbi:hypothetical protein BIV25_42955 [Streptomyces sp. MUSC 14]|uniref:hypothetical protein n=1 Tax=Streptomyces sp. MUSC 14 TaxID=1354889 RepID=UPI0008F567BF|nr:hypothetical protein [Streptomyces sp. MUSC 14]OIJ85746.1 hypothetical protein BIV25_42955 [Streptomyces sp. MUSC 14]